MIDHTTFYIFNEDGIIGQERIESLISQLILNESSDVAFLSKQDISPESSIYKKVVSDKVELTIYDHGYVFKVEGFIPEALSMVLTLDKLIEEGKHLYISPSQRIVNSPDLLLKRGLNLTELSIFFDRIFEVDDYTKSISRMSNL